MFIKEEEEDDKEDDDEDEEDEKRASVVESWPTIRRSPLIWSIASHMPASRQCIQESVVTSQSVIHLYI